MCSRKKNSGQAPWGPLGCGGRGGQAGRAPGAFDATRTWNPIAYDGSTALDVGRPGNPDLGPERSSEIELGFEGSALDERLSVNFTWYRKVTDDALFEVDQAPSLTGGWPGRLENVGKFINKGIELDATVTPIRGRYTWEFGAQVATVNSEVLDLGEATEIEVTSRGKTIALGRPVPFYKGNIILNPNEVGPPQVVEDVFLGPTQPTLTVAPHMSLSLPLLPGGRSVSLSARAEIRERGLGVLRSDRLGSCPRQYDGRELLRSSTLYRCGAGGSADRDRACLVRKRPIPRYPVRYLSDRLHQASGR